MTELMWPADGMAAMHSELPKGPDRIRFATRKQALLRLHASLFPEDD